MCKKLVLMCGLLVVCFSATIWAGTLKVEFNDTVVYGEADSPAGWYTIERNDIWSQGGQDVSFTFYGTDLGDVTIGIKNNTGAAGLAVGSGWENNYEPAGDLASVAKDALHIVCDEGCGATPAANIGLSFSGLLPYTVYQLTTYHTYFEPESYGGAAEPVTVSAGGVVQGTVTPGTPDPVNVGTDMPYIVSTFVTDGTGAYSDIAITAPPDADATGPKKMNAFTCGFELMIADHSRAFRPTPPNGSENLCQDVVLSWEPGQYADSHDVYFGTDYTDVKNATTATAGIYKANQEPNEYDAGSLETLVLSETYYWRIDEVNDACHPFLWAGDVWSFTINDGKAFDPSPVDGYARLFPGEALTWGPGCLATSHDVYIGTGYADVDAATSSVHPNVDYINVASPTYTPSLDPFTTYYWRVDAVGSSTFKGDVWTFKTGLGGLLMYYKFNGAPGSALPSPVIDDSGNGIAFTRYTDTGSIEYGDSNPMVLESTAAADFEPIAGLYRLDTGENDMLRLDGQEYTIEMWVRPEVLTQVYDDIMLIGKRGSWEVTIEDPEAGSNRAYNWMHAGKGLPMPNNSAVEGEWAHVAAVFDRYHSGSNNLRLYLNGAVQHAERFSYQNPSDDGKVTIGMEEIGDGPVYSGFLNGLIDELRIYDIALTPCDFLLTPGPEYAGCPNPYNRQYDVDPNLVLSWEPGSEATSHDVYLGTNYDDVLNATTNDVTGIFHGRVNVNHYPEAGILELEFSRTYYWRIDEVDGGVYKGIVWSFDTVSEIVDPNMRAWYRFDQKSGYTARDSSGRHYDAPVDTGDPDWDPNDGRFGGSLGFDNDTDVECPDAILGTIETAISISVWLKDAWREGGGTNWVFSSRERNGCAVYAAVVESSTGDVLWRAGDDSNDVLRWNFADADTVEDWHHWVFVKDEAADTISIYFDNTVVKSKDTENDDVNDTLVNIKGLGLRLGAAEGSANDFEGRMDDVRIYDKALSAAEIQALFRGGDRELAWAPDPLDGQPDISRDLPEVSWKAGDYAVSHNVYFGTDLQAVTDANTSVTFDVYKDNQPLANTNYAMPSKLELNQSYYWRIDEVNDSNVDSPWKGRVWSFRVANYITIEDFESYDFMTNFINETWLDGVRSLPYPPYFEYVNGATVALGASYTSPPDPVHRGQQSMMFGYDNTGWGGMVPYYSEAERIFDSAQDWTEADVKILTLFFYGDPDNDAGATEQMYVAVNDGGGDKVIDYGHYADEDMSDIKKDEWQQWNMALSDFGVTLTSIEKMYIGFGDRDNPVEGGMGYVYFDNVRLSPRKCVPSRSKPDYDFSSDCIVGFREIALLADEWLRTDVNFLELGIVPQVPDPAGLVAWWKLEQSDGSTAVDYKNGYHGVLQGGYDWTTGYDGGTAVDFDNGKVMVPDAPALRPQTAVSVSAWVFYSEGQNHSSRVVVKGAGNKETYRLEVTDDDNAGFHVRDVNNSNFAAGSDVWRSEWVHLAGTFDGDSNTLRCYVNGQLAGDDAENTEVDFVNKGMTMSQDTNDLAIGNCSDANDREFEGTIDDVRLYNYALSEAEVAWLAANGACCVPLRSRLNLYDAEPVGSKAVNMKDLAMIADAWMEQKLWPPVP